MNPIKKYLLLSFVSLNLILPQGMVRAQETEWSLVPTISSSAAELSRETGMDFKNFQLLNEILNAVDFLASKDDSEGTPFLTDEELIALHSIKMQLNDPLFLEASASQKGVELDRDLIFAMRTSKAAELLESTSRLLGDKMQPVIHVVNRRRIGSWSGAMPAIQGKRISELLDLDSEQQKRLAELADQYKARKKEASKALADGLRKLRDEYRAKMVRCLDVHGRRWFDATFGEPVDLLDENGQSIFFELVEKYDFAPSDGVLETVRSFAADSGTAHRTSAGREGQFGQEDGSETIAVDAIEYALIRSDLVQQEMDLTESQSKAIREAFIGKQVELTNKDRDSRLKQLIAGDAASRSELRNVLSPSQIERLDQIEIQIRTSGNLDSFGILDVFVALHLELGPEDRREVAQLSQEYRAAVANLLNKHRAASQQMLREYQQQSFDVLRDAQKQTFASFFGDFDR